MPRAKKAKAKTAAATRTTRAEATRLMYSRIPKLPNEIVDAILEILKEEGKFETLASVARVNHTMYDIAIPKIYETVVFTRTSEKVKNNHAMIAYGHSPSVLHSGRRNHDGHKLTADNHANNIPNRKDIATSHTRTLVFHDVPELEIPRSYRAVNQVEIRRRCLDRSYMYHDHATAFAAAGYMERRLQRCLKIVTSSKSSADSVHVLVYDSALHQTEWENLGRLLTQFESAIPCTFEFFDLCLYDDYRRSTPLQAAYEVQAVVHFETNTAFWPYSLYRSLALSIDNIFNNEDKEAPVGQLFLCDLRHARSRPGDFDRAQDFNEAGLITLCNCITVWPDLSGSQYETKLDFLKSRIKLVEPGFRPSLADFYPKPQATRGLCHMLVDKETIVPDDEWSLTDEDPIESESEYCGSETSCSDAGSSDGDMDDGEN